MAKRSIRQLRVGELIRAELARLLRLNRMHDPIFDQACISVTEVVVSPDFSVARVYLTALNADPEHCVIPTLEQHQSTLRKAIAAHVRLRTIPRLVFIRDERQDQALRIEDLLNTPNVKRDLEPDSP